MAALTFVLPKFLSVEEFGYWQLFQFYVLYLGYLTFGYSDGVLLRLAGKPRDVFPSKDLSTGWIFLLLAESLLFVGIIVGAFFFMEGHGWTLLTMACLGVMFFIPRVLFTFIFQAAGEVRLLAFSTLVERFVLLIGFAVFIFNSHWGLWFLIASDIAGKFVGFVVSLLAARRLLLNFSGSWRAGFQQFIQDCKSGSFVVLSNLSAISLNGSVRLLVGLAFGTVVFGQLSLALQVSTVLLVVINAIGMAVFPNLKRQDPKDYSRSYRALHRGLVTPALLSLLLCWPTVVALTAWLPDYTLAIQLIAVLFPVGFYEVKSRGVLSVFLKAVREERRLFIINLAAAILGAALCFVGIYVIESIHWAAISIVVALAARTTALELLLASRLSLDIRQDLLVETLLVGVFYLYLLSDFSLLSTALLCVSFGAYAVRWVLGIRRLRLHSPSAS